MEEVSNVVSQRIVAVLVGLLVAFSITRLAFLKGFFDFPKNPPPVPVNGIWKHTFAFFAIFLGTQITVISLLQSLRKILKYSAALPFIMHKSEVELDGWITQLSILITGILLLTYYLTMNKQARNAVWGKASSFAGALYQWGFGVMSWVVVYPWIFVLGQLFALLLYFTIGEPHIDQNAVKLVKDILNYPLLFGITIFSIGVLVPFLEELMFRGFLQTALKNVWGTKTAITLTSLIFAFFHFSSSQGIENVELIVALFFLACFLGYIKERQNSLWASIGLHSTFNLISLVMIAITEN